MSDPPLVRNSGLGDFGRCPWLWSKVWLEGIAPRRPPTWSIFGRAMHTALEVRYQIGTRRAPLEQAQEAFLAALNGEIRKVGVDVFQEEYDRQERAADDSGKSVKLVAAHELGPIMLAEFVASYHDDDEWEVIHREQPFQINVPYPTTWGRQWAGKTMVVYCGTWDVLMRNRRTGQYWLWDWKTCKKLPSERSLEANDQAGSYVWVAREVLRHKGIFTAQDRIEGIIFQYLKKSLPDPRPRNAAGESLNQNGSVSLKQPAARFLRLPSYRSPEQIIRQARRVQTKAILMEQMRDDPDLIYKTHTHECERCILWDLCTAHEAGDDWEMLQEELFMVRDPFADHREAMAQGGIEL